MVAQQQSDCQHFVQGTANNMPFTHLRFEARMLCNFSDYSPLLPNFPNRAFLSLILDLQHADYILSSHSLFFVAMHRVLA